MKKFFSRYCLNTALIAICAILCVPFFFLYTASHFLPTSPDTLRVLIGVKEIAEEGDIPLNIYENGGYSPGKSDANILYPQFQLLIFTFSTLSGIGSQYILVGVVVLLTVTIFLLFFLVFQKIYTHSLAVLLTAFFGVTSISVVRAVILTPQGLFGFVFILLSVYFFLRYVSTKHFKDALLIVFSLCALLIFHHLSFFVVLPVYCVYFVVKSKNKALIVLGGIVLTFAGVAFLVFGLKQFHIFYDIARSFSNPLIDNVINANSVLDFPAQIGYTLFLVACFSFIFLKRVVRAEYWLFIKIFLVISFVLSYMHYMGIYFFPDRLVLYTVFPVLFFIPQLFIHLEKKLSRMFFISFLMVIVSAHFVHSIAYAYDDYTFFTVPHLPASTEYDAYAYLNKRRSDGGVLAAYNDTEKSSLFLPYFIQNTVSFYTLNNSFKDSDLEDLADFEIARYMMFKNPESPESEQFFDEYDIQFVYLGRNSRDDSHFREAETFMRSFQNEDIVIYERK